MKEWFKVRGSWFVVLCKSSSASKFIYSNFKCSIVQYPCRVATSALKSGENQREVNLIPSEFWILNSSKIQLFKIHNFWLVVIPLTPSPFLLKHHSGIKRFSTNSGTPSPAFFAITIRFLIHGIGLALGSIRYFCE